MHCRLDVARPRREGRSLKKRKEEEERWRGWEWGRRVELEVTGVSHTAARGDMVGSGVDLAKV